MMDLFGARGKLCIPSTRIPKLVTVIALGGDPIYGGARRYPPFLSADINRHTLDSRGGTFGHLEMSSTVFSALSSVQPTPCSMC